MSATPRSRLCPDRFPIPVRATWEERLDDTREMLIKCLGTSRTVVFCGNGCSTPLCYPRWEELVRQLAAHALSKLESSAVEIAIKDHFTPLLAAIRTRTEPERLMTSLATCEKVLDRVTGSDDAYREFLENNFSKPPKKPIEEGEEDRNPYLAILDLPVFRFATTNYDLEIERALYYKRAVEFPELELTIPGSTGQERTGYSLTHESDAYSDELVLTALSGVAFADNTVLHCHGRIDRPDSIIATEDDYRKLYLTNVAKPRYAFANSLDILFGSSPILFVGYGLADEDLLRPLRLFRLRRRDVRDSPPIFALVSQVPENPRYPDCDHFSERYGVQVLPYPRRPKEDRGFALCRALRQLGKDLDLHRENRVKKPPLRKVYTSGRQTAPPPKEPYFHYACPASPEDTIGPDQVDSNLVKIADSFDKRAPITVLLGPGGVGKSWHAVQLIDRLYKKRVPFDDNQDFQGFFFWSSYYTYDTLTGLERLASYVNPDAAASDSALERIRQKSGEPYLIVLDGFERLLLVGENPDKGRIYDAQVRDFLSIFSDNECKLRLLLTTRLMPEPLQPDQPLGNVITLNPIGSTAFFEHLTKNRSPEEEAVPALYSLLNGHSYGLALAARILSRSEGPKPDKAELTELLRRLCDAAPHERLATVIRRSIEIADAAASGLAQPMLERLAMFMGPVGQNVLPLCHDLAVEGQGKSRQQPRSPSIPRQGIIETLKNLRLVYPTKATDDTDAWYVHPTVRSYIFEYVQGARRDAPPNFTLPGFTSGNAAVYPGSPRSKKVILDLFNRIHGTAAVADGYSERGSLCRSLFALVRSRMESNTATRWLKYGDYALLLLRLLNLAREVARPEQQWANCPSDRLETIQYEDAFLYADELAWIYNDLGLAFCSEGQMEDTLDLWTQGYEINRLIERGKEVTRYSLQSQLHLAHTFLERGELRLATDYLNETERTNQQVDDKDYEGRILGYRGLLTHLHADLEKADDLYKRALDTLSEAGGNPRAESYFLRHRAALSITLGQLPLAQRYADASLARAEIGEYPDMIAFARSTRGGVFRARRKLSLALTEYESALRGARKWGVRRLETEVLGEQARVYLALGDGSIALQHATESLKIANSLHMGLRQTSSLIYLGKALALQKMNRMAESYLRHALRLAGLQGYMLKAREAEEALDELGVNLDAAESTSDPQAR